MTITRRSQLGDLGNLADLLRILIGGSIGYNYAIETSVVRTCNSGSINGIIRRLYLTPTFLLGYNAYRDVCELRFGHQSIDSRTRTSTSIDRYKRVLHICPCTPVHRQ
ncbi:hypothetical protein A0H81_03430 [Grifola frondosa]|uniref:Uncharacterized protein n=1 Tax=Grifola frondosa TaxID=5627 RepID=A0A1C7MHV0_GRIFR|nr:hypothetical protein A0H81_03430 [Grifola frondosa]